MEILISFQSKIPIYEQIVMQIKKKIIEGQLEVGTVLPAMRTFAKTLNVSVITVQKAYEILQEEGFITSVVGKGTFVTIPKINVLKDQKKEELIAKMKQIINLGYSNGYNKEELMKIFIEQCELLYKNID
ncbi:GntR family transcriptional regulator [Enterococcus sp.]|uniref:GntR family transcriptional regulator n=1 Tax=Enterococcus sp. TaxID=35783 RepID=UPI001B6CA78F|nr:GntR family transcriptional regulator [Enterococcus sp.]MBP8751141.1 GntR family transcriptional regulator [Enterococcus sp.]HRA72682.1 GntR family transcriptional regulator [Flavobacterium sp.]